MAPSLKRTVMPGTTQAKKPKRTLASATSVRAPKAATSSVKPATFAAQAVQSPPSPNPGASSTGQARRTDAQTNYGLTVNDINRQLLQAAMRYGGDPMAALYNLSGSITPTAVQTDDPNSALATIARTMKDNTKSLQDELTQNNTFFSGMHLTRQQDVNDQADRDKAEAYRQYQDAVAQLQSGFAQANAGYNSELRNANLDDIAQAASYEPAGNAQAPVGAAVQTKIATSSQYPNMQMTGPNAGIAYQIATKNGKRYKYYADGRPPVPA